MEPGTRLWAFLCSILAVHETYISRTVTETLAFFPFLMHKDLLYIYSGVHQFSVTLIILPPGLASPHAMQQLCNIWNSTTTRILSRSKKTSLPSFSHILLWEVQLRCYERNSMSFSLYFTLHLPPRSGFSAPSFSSSPTISHLTSIWNMHLPVSASFSRWI